MSFSLRRFFISSVFMIWSLSCISAFGASTVQTPAELERARLAEIVTGLDQLVNQVEAAASVKSGGRVQFNYPALKHDLLSRRVLIQNYVNGSWQIPQDAPPMADTYNR